MKDKTDGSEYYCINCRRSISSHTEVCPYCGADTKAVIEEEEDSFEEDGGAIVVEKYPALRVIATLYQVIAILIGILTLIGFLLSVQSSTPLIMVVSLAVGGNWRCLIHGTVRKHKSIHRH